MAKSELKMKRMMRTGKPVHATDKGRPLSVLHPTAMKDDEQRRRREIEKELATVLRELKSKIPLSKIVLESR